MEQNYLDQGTNLSADVEPFIPRSDIGNMYAEPMINQPASGQLPHYLTSCYPFVQDPNSSENNQRMNQNNMFHSRDMNMWPVRHPAANGHFHPQIPPRFGTPTPQGPPPNLPMPSTPLFSYHTGASPFPPHQFPGLSQSPFPQQMYIDSHNQDSSTYHPVKRQYRREPSGKKYQIESKKLTNKRTGRRSVGIQMEAGGKESHENDGSSMVDNGQQTDFPSEIALKTLSEKPSPLKKATRTMRHRRRATATTEHSGSCDSSDNEGGEADVDSDSGYYSPKHQISRRHNATGPTRPFRDDQHNVGTGAIIPPPYLNNSMSPQRVFFVHSQSTLNAQGDYYQKQPNSFTPGPPPPPRHIVQIQGSATPPLLMTSPAIRPEQARQQHALVIANFKSRSTWEQEILKAHNVAPVIPPFFGSGHQQGPMQKRHMGGVPQTKYNTRYPGPNILRQNVPLQNYDQKNFYEASRNNFNAKNVNSLHNHGHGILHLNQKTPPPHLRYQAPPQLTDEDFPGLQTSLSVSESQDSSKLMSYSAALQTKARPISDINISNDSPIKNLIEISDAGQGKSSRRRRKKTERAAKAAAEEYAEISKEQENIKKQLSKKSPARSNKGRSPQLNMAEMLSKLEQKELSQLEVIAQEGKTQTSTRRVQMPHSSDAAPHNPLDASAPSKKRGKEREVPKAKKPSALKKVILKEREEKKNSRVVALSTEEKPDYDIPSMPPDIFNNDYENLPKDVTDLNNNSEVETTASGAASSDNQSPLTVSVSGNSSPVVPLPKIHSRRYREYCCQVLDKQIDETCTVILQKLVQFQERMYQKDPIKAKSKRRFVLGLREVTKHLKLKKLKCVLISPNLEKIQSKGGLDDAMQNILQLCKEQSLPYVFALGRCAMGRAVSKLVPVSIIGIFDYSGVENQYKRMLDLVAEAQRKYNEMISMYKQEASTPPVVPAAAKRFAHMGHSRNPSAASCVSFCSMISEPISELNPAEGTSWRNMMEITDELSPAPALSPPPENANEDDSLNDPQPPTEISEEIAEEEDGENQVEEKELEEAMDRSSSTNSDSYLNAIDNSGSLPSDDKVSGEIALDKSFSTVSTVVARTTNVDPEMTKSSLVKLSLASSGSGIPSIVEHPPPSSSDTTARINSWLEAASSSVEALDIEDPATPPAESKLVPMHEDGDVNQDEDEFASANEGEDSRLE